ncbi:MAG: hypothetical protein PHX18_04300 [Candidatus Gastranaerophilales bacterium]|nr:hypothetical protein [Candidatus Gastranaerophilales bacterium]
MTLPSQKIINETISHFSDCGGENITEAEAIEIVSNIVGFSRLMMKLDKKRQEALLTQENNK